MSTDGYATFPDRQDASSMTTDKRATLVGMALMLAVLTAGEARLLADDDPPPPPAGSVFPRWAMARFPGGWFVPTYLETYAPDTTLLNEESNGFAMLDSPRVYYSGESPLHFNWYYGPVSLTSVLHPGTAALALPFSAVDRFDLRRETPALAQTGLHLIPATADLDSGSSGMFSIVDPNMGEVSSTFQFLMNTPAIKRNRLLYETRRRFRENVFLEYGLRKRFAASSLLAGVQYWSQERQFNDFTRRNDVFSESGSRLLLHGLYRRQVSGGVWDVFAAADVRERSHWNAEYGVYPQETVSGGRFALLAGAGYAAGGLQLSLSALHEYQRPDASPAGYAKDLIDNDGDAIYPQGPEVTRHGTALQFFLQAPILKEPQPPGTTLGLFLDGRYSFLTSGASPAAVNEISMASRPYRVWLWDKGAATSSNLLRVSGGVQADRALGRDVHLMAKAWALLVRVNPSGRVNDQTWVEPGLDLGLGSALWPGARLHVAAALAPGEVRENLAEFLEQGAPSATVAGWIDSNGDRRYQPNEKGSVAGYSGGPNHFLDAGILFPRERRLMVSFEQDLSAHWRVNVHGLYKKFANPLWVSFKDQYGIPETVNGRTLFFFDRPYKNFFLGNAPSGPQPFYAQACFQVAGQREQHWLFSLSFLTHIGMSQTAFGNGPLSNDPGIIAESQADPNSQMNAFGRVDGDRAFVARLFSGFYPAKDLFFALSLKYRDGNPFAFLNADYRHDQWVLTYSTIKAEDSHFKKGGPREDYMGELNLQLTYRRKVFGRDVLLSVAGFNLLDVGYELSEYVFSGGARDAMELQIPRSLRVTLAFGM
jgi:hypothetical protein